MIFFCIWLPYFTQTYKLKTLAASDLPSGAWVSLEKGNLYYRWYYPDAKVMNNETVVLVHGFSTPHFVWDGMKGFLLDAGYSVLVFDHYGRGYSERPKLNIPRMFLFNPLEDCLILKNSEVHLVGYSMGGPM